MPPDETTKLEPEIAAELDARSDAATKAASPDETPKDEATASDADATTKDESPDPGPEAGDGKKHSEKHRPRRPSIDSVLRVLPSAEPNGAIITRPDGYLTGEQALIVNRIYHVLHDQGLTLRSQADVFAWLLDEIADAIADRSGEQGT